MKSLSKSGFVFLFPIIGIIILVVAIIGLMYVINRAVQGLTPLLVVGITIFILWFILSKTKIGSKILKK